MTGAKKGEGRVRKRRQKGKGRGRRGSPLTSLPNPFSLFLSLSQSPTSSLPPYCACWLDEKSSFADRWSKGTKTQGTRVLLSPPISTLSTQADQGWKTCIHTYLDFFSGKNVSGDFHQNLMKHESWRIKTFSVKGLAQNRMSQYLYRAFW